MPNTIAHLGIQALVTRGVIRKAEPAWIWIGCILPDLPWIGQRAIRALPLEISPFDVRLYAIVQSSLVFSCLAAVGLAMFAPRPARIAAILVLGNLLHLLLDATQIKWANGVVLFAPFDWSVTGFDLYWPEDWPSHALTLLGGLTFAWLLWKSPPGAVERVRLSPRRWAVAIGALLAYLLLPVAYMETAALQDPHYVATLRDPDARANRCVEFDRNTLEPRLGGGAVLKTWYGEFLPTIGIVPPTSTMLVSLKGCFTENDEFQVEMLHEHPPGRRSFFTFIGLLMISLWLCLSLLSQFLGSRSRD